MPSLKKNLIINISYQVFVVLLPLIVAPYVTRTIGPEGAGIYSYTYSIASCFALIGMLGIANHGNRSVAATNADKISRGRIFCNIWAIQITCTSIACILYLLYCFLAPIDHKNIAYIQVVTVLCSAFDISWFFFGIEKFNITVSRNIIVKLLNLVLIFSLVKSEDDVTRYIIIMVSGYLLNNLLLFVFLKKEVHLIRPTIEEIKTHIKPIIILFFPVIAISIYKLMDKVMIGALSTKVETGYYEYAEKIIGLPGTVITAIGVVMLPRLSNIVGQKKKEHASFLLQVTMEAMMFLTIGMSVGIFSVGMDFAPLFFGEKFAKSGLIMMALSPSVIFQGWANVIRTEYLIPKKKDSIYVKSAWLGAIVNLILNTLLIPLFQAVGAAVGTVGAELAVALFQTICSRKELPIREYLKKVWFYAIPAVVMWITIRFVHIVISDNTLRIIYEILFGIIAYCIISMPYIFWRYTSLKGLGKDDIKNTVSKV